MRTNRLALSRTSLLIACGLISAAFARPASAAGTLPAVARRVDHASVPVRFEPNHGQAAKDVRFVGHAAGYSVALKPGAVTISTQSSAASRVVQSDTLVTMTLAGARSDAAISPFGELPGKSNYLPSSDRRSWILGLPNYAGVLYRGVYPGTDLVFRGDDSRFEYDFHIAPGGDPSRIAWRLTPGFDVRLDAGDLVIASAGTQLRFRKPVAYQQYDGVRRPVTSEYRLRRDARGARVEFAVGPYDRGRALVIDPVLVYSTQVSGMSIAQSATVDAGGNVYLASGNNSGVQVVKLAPDGKTVLYTTTFGTNSTDIRNVTVDGAGQVYVTGQALSGLPTTAGAYQSSVTTGWHAFLTVVDASGTSLVYSTYLAGSTSEIGQGVTLDPSGKVLVSGVTYSSDFPNTNNVALNGSAAAFVAKFDIAQSGSASLLYSALLPSTNYDSQAIAAKTDSAGNVYVALDGIFSASNGAFRYDAVNSSYGGVYVAKLNSAGATQYVAYLGYGTAADLAVDNAGNAYVTGTVYSGDFPATQGAYQTSYPNAFLSKLNPSGASLLYSTYLGGPSGLVYPASVTVPAGCTTNCTPVVGGYTYATDFPLVNAIQNALAGSYDAFIVTLTADGSNATFSTYLGGSNDDAYYDYTGYHLPQVGLDASGNIYVAGDTASADFPFTNRGGTAYTFVTKISPAAGAMLIPDISPVSFPSQTLGVQSAPLVVNFRNYGTVVATITGGPVSDNPAFTSTNNCGGSVPAGGTCAVQVYYTPNVAGNVTGTLSLTYNNGTSTATATTALAGYGYDRPEVHITPGGDSYFGAVTVNSTSAAYTYTATNVGSRSATIYSIYVGDTTNFTVSSTNCPGVLNPGASCTFTIAFAPKTIGELSTYYYVSSNAYISPYYYAYLYGTGSGVGSSGITPISTALNFPDQVVGTTSTDFEAELQNTGSIPVTFGTAAVTGDFILYYSGCDGRTIVPGGSCYIGIEFKPTVAGTRTGSVTISNSAGPDQVVALSGNGITAATGLVFSPNNVVFSDQVIGTASGAVSMVVSNTGNSPVTITRVYDNGGAFQMSSNGCLTTLAPFSSCYVYAKFAPTTAGALTGSITFVDSAAGSPQSIALSGNGVSPTSSLTASPTTATFDDTTVGSYGNTDYLFLYNPGNLKVTTSTPVPSSSDWVVTYNGCGTVNPGGTCEIDVRFQPQSAGTLTGTLTIPNSSAGSPVVINLNGTGIVAANSIVATPLSLSFSDTVVGAISSTQAVTFYNPGNAPVTVTGATALGGTNAGEFTVTSDYCANATIQPGYSCPVYLYFNPTGAAGTRSATLTLNDSAPGSPHVVTLTGNAVNSIAALIATPASLGFDDQVVGTTSSSSIVTLYNPGNTTVTISNTAVSGDFAVTSACSTIGAHGSCNMYLTFTPTAAGQRSGTITLTDDASGSPQGIALYGNGLAASRTLAVIPASIDFGNVITSANASTQTVYLLNTGTQSVTISAPSVTSPYTVSGCNTTLNPGVSCAITLSINSATAGSFPGTLTITDDASGSPQTVTLAANVVSTTPAISITPNGLTFDHRVVNTTSGTLNAGFTNRSGSTITFTGISTTGDFAIGTNNCSSVANNGSCNVTVTFTPTATGVRTGTLVFSQAAGATTIALRGYGDPATSLVQLSASSLSFPDQVVGTTSSAQTFRVWNNGTTPLTVNTPTITVSPVGVPVDFAVSSNSCTGSIGAGNSCDISVTYSPSIAGNPTGTLTFTSSDSGSPHSVSLAGVGVNATKTMEPSATSIQFNDQVIGTTSSVQTIYFTNTGNTTVTGSASTITAGDFAIQYDGCNTSIAPRSYCYVNIAFTPTTSGSRTATLSVNNNAPGSPQTVSISGKGVTATKTYRLTASALTFNDQPVGTQSYTQYVYLYNTGTASINVGGTTLTGGDYTISDGCSTRTLPAGDYCYVGVSFQPTATGPRTGSLSIANDAPAGAASVSLSANGIAATKLAHVSATSLTFSDQAVGVTSPYQYFYVYNTGNVGVNVGTVSVTGDFAILYDYCSGYTISAGSYCNVYVTFKPTAAGTRTGTVTIPDDSTTSPHTVSLSGNGLTPSLRLNFNPGNMNFPPTPTGSTSRAIEVQVSNLGNAPLSISSASVSGADFKITYNSCSGTVLQPGATSYYYSCYVDVELQPTTTGALSGSLVFVDAAADSPQSLPLTGTGIDPTAAVQVSQNSITFPDQATNIKSSPALVYISNAGSSSALISTLAISGDFSTSGCAAPITLYQYGSCALYVYFTPTATGARTGSITITDNSAGSPHVISLSGNGVNPAPLVNLLPASIAFGNQPVSQTSSYQSVQLYNNGTAPLLVSGMVSTSTEFGLNTGCVTTIAVGSYCTFYVNFTPQGSGTRTGAIQITDNATGSPHTLALSGTGIGSLVQLNPTTLNFGNQNLGSASTPQSVVLTNSGNVTLNISSITGSGDFTQTNNCPAALAAAASCTINVTFTPSVQGVRTSSITIVDDGAGSPQVVVVQGVGAQPQADLALTGAASPPGLAPGGTTNFNFTVINNGTATATGLTFTASLPTNATVNGVTAPGGTCTVDTTINCTLNDLAASATTTISVSATNTVAGNMTINASVATTQSEPYTANNSVVVTADAGVADLSLGVTPLSTSAGFVFAVTNNGPNSASNVTLTCAYNRYLFSGSTSTQGSCSSSGGSVSCFIGSMVSGAVVNVTQLVQPPSQGWAGIACHAGALEFDSNPVNNSAQISPEGVNNTSVGDNVGVALIDRVSGQTARVVFPTVKAGGVTTLTGISGAVPPAGFRTGAQAWTYDLTTTASTSGSPTVTFSVPAAQFHHPAQVRLFHLENGVWVDRTVVQDPSTASVAAVSQGLSPFALFEPLNHAPVANPGADRFAAATSAAGAKVTLDAGASADADGDPLTYRWSGPFPEGNGVVTGVRPSVTLPFGTSKVMLVANDGESDSVPAAVSFTVTDFGVAPVASSVDVVRGSSATIPVQVQAVGGAYDQAVSLSCTGLPAGVSCSFSPATVQPGTTGATSNLTISTTTTAASSRRPATWAFAVMMFGVVGVFGWTDKRRRSLMLLGLLALALLIGLQVGCGGGSVSGISNQPAPSATTTVTITVKGTASGLTHSSNVSVTLH